MKLYAVCWVYYSQTRMEKELHVHDPVKLVYAGTGGLGVFDMEHEAREMATRLTNDGNWIFDVVEVEV